MKILSILWMISLGLLVSSTFSEQLTQSKEKIPPFISKLEKILQQRQKENRMERYLLSNQNDEDLLNNNATNSTANEMEIEAPRFLRSEVSGQEDVDLENDQKSGINEAESRSVVSQRSDEVASIANISGNDKSEEGTTRSGQILSESSLRSGQTLSGEKSVQIPVNQNNEILSETSLDKEDSQLIDRISETGKDSQVQEISPKYFSERPIENLENQDIKEDKRIDEDIDELENLMETINQGKDNIQNSDQQFKNVRTDASASTGKTILHSKETQNAEQKAMMDQEAIESKLQGKGGIDSLSNLVNDFAKEAAEIAEEEYSSDQLSPSGIDLNVPKVQVTPSNMTGMGQGGVAISSSPEKGMKHGKFQDDVSVVMPANLTGQHMPSSESQDIPDELIDEILRSSQRRRAQPYVLDQQGELPMGIFGGSPHSVQVQRIPEIQGYDDTLNPTSIFTSSHTSVNPIDQSLDHHQIQHTVHEDPLSGKQLHSFEGTSVNIPQPDAASASQSMRRGNPMDVLVGGLLNLFKSRNHQKEDSPPEIPVVINKSQMGSGGGSGLSDPINKVKNLFDFGRPNGSPNDFNEYSDENLMKIMNDLKEHHEDDQMEMNPLTNKLMLDEDHLQDSPDLPLNADSHLSDSELQNLISEEMNHDLQIPQDSQKDDHSEGDEILYHSGKHDESEFSQDHHGDELVHIIGPFGSSNRLQDEHSQDGNLNILPTINANDLVDENQVLEDHLNQKTQDDHLRQKAIDDLLNQLIGSTDFSSVQSEASQHPLMGNMYTTSSLGIPKKSMDTHFGVSPQNAFSGSQRLSDSEIQQLGLSQKGKKFSDVDDLISHLQGNDLNLGIKQEGDSAADQYLMNVLRNTDEHPENLDNLSPKTLEFFKTLEDDNLVHDLNEYDHKILSENEEKNGGLKSTIMKGSNRLGDLDEDDLKNVESSISNQEDLEGKQIDNSAENETMSTTLKRTEVAQPKIHSKHFIHTNGGGFSDNKLKNAQGNSRISNKDVVIQTDQDPKNISDSITNIISSGKGTGMDIGMGMNTGMEMDKGIGTGFGMDIGKPMSKHKIKNINKFGSTHYEPGELENKINKFKRVSTHKHKKHKTVTTHVDTTELTQVLSQLAKAFGGRHRHHHRHRHHKHHRHINKHKVSTSTNIHINQGESTDVNRSKIHTSTVNQNSLVNQHVKQKENKIVNIENVIHHIYRQPKRKQKINIKVTVKPMGGLKATGPCEDNCEEEINKHIEEIMDLDNTKAEPSEVTHESHLSEITDTSNVEINLNQGDQPSEKSQESKSQSSSISQTDSAIQSIRSSEAQTEKSSPKSEFSRSKGSSSESIKSSIDESPKLNVVESGDIDNDRKLMDVDTDTFYNHANSEERRMAQMEFRRTIQQMMVH